MPQPQLNINGIADGALLERVGIEMQRLAENIADPNTKATAVRSVTIEIKVKPDETRSIASSEINVKSKLSPSQGIPTKFLIDRDNKGQVVMAELVSGAKGQMMIDSEGELADDKGEKVVNMQDKKANFR